MITNLQTLHIGGSVKVSIQNIGNAPALVPPLVTLFEDSNSNGMFDEGVDNTLGSITMPSGLERDAQLTLDVAVNGESSFRDNYIYAMVDSDQKIDEGREDNNIGNNSSSMCVIPPPDIGSFEPVQKWHWNNEKVLTIPLVSPLFDTNHDGKINEYDDSYAIFASHTGFVDHSQATLRVVNGVNGQEVWSFNGLKTEGSAHPVVGDIDGDGIPEIIMYLHSGGVAAINNDGSLKWSVTEPPRVSYYNYGSISLADLDGDGKSEILARNYVLNHDGSVRWIGPNVGHSIYSLGVDFNLDGQLEVIIGGNVFNADGTPYWAGANAPYGLQAIGNFDQDDYPEIALVGGGAIYLYDNDGRQMWKTSVPGGGGGAPTIADMDGDGLPEIGVAGRSRYVVVNHDGSILWSSQTQDYSSQTTGSTVFDFNGDGISEVVYADETKLRVYEGKTGSVVFSIPNSSATATEYPVVADIDGDGHAELLVVSDRGEYGIRAFEDHNDIWMPTRHIWNQHAYHIDNINNDASIPSNPAKSWKTHNTFRLNTFPDRDPRGIVDLTASQLRIIDNGAGQPASLSVRIGNAGTESLLGETSVVFYQGNPEFGGALLGTVPVSALPAGQYTDVVLDNVNSLSGNESIYAIVDYDSRIIECNETNNSVELPVAVLSNSGSISVGADYPLYGPQSPVELQANITNTSAIPGEYESELRIEDQQGNVVVIFARRVIGPLVGGAATQYTEPWNTGSTIAGTYNLHGFLYNMSGELLDDAVSQFDIRHSTQDVLALNLRTSTDKPVYHTTDTVNIEDLVQNLTLNVPVSGADLLLRVYDPDGVQVFENEQPIAELLPHAQRILNDVMPLSNALEGNYLVEGSVLNTLDEVLVSDDTSFLVQEDISKSIVGTVTAQHPSVYQGEQQTCTYAVENQGTQDLPDLMLRQITAAIETETQVRVEINNHDLLAGTTNPDIIDSFSTGIYELGMYSCILQAKIDGEWTTLDNAVFEVKEPPIKINATLGAGDRGRVLVLLDDERQECIGVTSIGLEGSFAEQLSADTSVEVKLFDQGGSLIDTELAQVDTREINQNTGTGGIDLSIEDFSASHIALSVGGTGTASGELGAGYQVVATVTGTSGNLALDSGQVVTDCGQSLNINGQIGSYRIASLGLNEAANDPLGPNHTPGLLTQRVYLENLLTQAGWSYTIVTDKDLFASELRAGGYVDYLLLSEKVKLDEQVQKELREAVFRGEGLVEAGGHDQRQGRIDDALGIKFIGKHSGMSGVSLTDSALHTAASGEFGLNDRQLRTQTEGATVVGYFSDTSGTVTTDPAVTVNNFGEGRSAHLGFDLLAEATLMGGDNLYGELILDSLSYVHPTQLAPLSGLAYPIKLTLQNEGMATPGRVITTIPSNTEVIDAGGGTVADNTLTWPFDLAVDETETFTTWLALPQGMTHIESLVQTGVDPDYVDHVTVEMDVVSQDESSITDVLSMVGVLNDKKYKQVEKYLGWAEQDVAAGNYLDAVSALTRASDALVKIGTSQSEDIRLHVAKLLRMVSRRI